MRDDSSDDSNSGNKKRSIDMLNSFFKHSEKKTDVNNKESKRSSELLSSFFKMPGNESKEDFEDSFDLNEMQFINLKKAISSDANKISALDLDTYVVNDIYPTGDGEVEIAVGDPRIVQLENEVIRLRKQVIFLLMKRGFKRN